MSYPGATTTARILHEAVVAPHRSPRSARLAALVAAGALAAGGCGGGGDPAPAVLVPLPAPATTRVPSPSTVTVPAAATARTPPGRLTVQVTQPIGLHARPGGPLVGRIAPHTQFGSAAVLPVVRQRGSWLGVISPALPDGRIGWIAASTGLVAYRTQYSVVASLRRREVVVRRAGRVVLRFPVAIGSPATPTPTGQFAVTDKLLTQDPGSPYGCCILALSAHQTHTPQGWGGGDRVAIHATNLPETIGTAASLGCLRGPADEVRRIVQLVPLGTIVTVRA
ncbi:MAG TPA: L,D-transpeptidase [Conexibacter sp.]|jgi:lipoprotein-anchoring transpeptidase ErfK/SrfK|nr:L,D-transpeptidase [Conexibacter sp.]